MKSLRSINEVISYDKEKYRENDNCASITLVLSDEKSSVKMTLSEVDGFERETKHLVVKKRDNELLVYERKKSLDYNTIPTVT